MSAGLLAAIPIYTDAVLQRLLVQELESRQRERGRHPGRTSAMINLFRAAPAEQRSERFRELDAAIGAQAIPSLGLPVLAHTTQLTLSFLVQDNERDGARLFLSVEALDGLLDEVEVVHGRAFGARDDGVLEAIISEYVLREHPVLLGDELQVSSVTPDGPAFTVRIVGVYRPAADSRLFWPYGLRQYDDSLLVDYGEFRRRFLDRPISHVAEVRWHYALDYHALRVGALGEVLQRHHEFLRMAEPSRVEVQFPLQEVIGSYLVRAGQLRLTLTLLLVPVALLLSFFTYLVARLLVESERDAIATLRSRGAGARTGRRHLRGAGGGAGRAGAGGGAAGGTVHLGGDRRRGRLSGLREPHLAAGGAVAPRMAVRGGRGGAVHVHHRGGGGRRARLDRRAQGCARPRRVARAVLAPLLPGRRPAGGGRLRVCCASRATVRRCH